MSIKTNSVKEYHPKKTPLPRTLFEIVKQLDDLFMYGVSKIFGSVLSAQLGAIISTVLSGGVGSLIGINEAKDGFNDAREAMHNKLIGQRKTRLVTGGLNTLLGLAAVGLSVAGIAGFFGAVVIGLNFMPFLFVSCYLTIYTLKLQRQSYILYRAKQIEAEFKASVQELEDLKNAIDFLNENTAPGIKTELLFPSSSLTAIKKYNYFDAHASLSCHDIKQQLDKRYSELSSKLDPQTITVQSQGYRAAVLKAERAVSYATLDAISSVLIFVSTGLAALALLSIGGALTFGILPTVLLAAGIAMGVGCKIFEKIDERKEFTLSAKIRNWFTPKPQYVLSNKKNQVNNLSRAENSHSPINAALNKAALSTVEINGADLAACIGTDTLPNLFKDEIITRNDPAANPPTSAVASLLLETTQGHKTIEDSLRKGETALYLSAKNPHANLKFFGRDTSQVQSPMNACLDNESLDSTKRLITTKTLH